MAYLAGADGMMVDVQVSLERPPVDGPVRKVREESGFPTSTTTGVSDRKP